MADYVFLRTDPRAFYIANIPKASLETLIMENDVPAITYLLGLHEVGDLLSSENHTWQSIPIWYAGLNRVSFLNMAICLRRFDIMSLLWKHGHYQFSVDVYGRTPLHAAVETGCHKMVVFLLRRGCDIKLKNACSVSCGSWNPNYNFCGVSEPLYFIIPNGGPCEPTTGEPRYEYRGNTDVRYVINGGIWKPPYHEMFHDSFRAMVRVLLLTSCRISMNGKSIPNDVICYHVLPLCNWEFFISADQLQLFELMRLEFAFRQGKADYAQAGYRNDNYPYRRERPLAASRLWC